MSSAAAGVALTSRPNASGRSGGKRRSPMKTSTWWALLFIGPTALGLGLFYLWPALRTFLISFTATGPFGGSEWVGGENYARLLTDERLPQALLNTFAYSGIALLGIPLALFIAGLLNTRVLKGRSIYRTLYFIPVVTMPAAIAIVWRMIYNGDYGILNQFLGVAGIEGKSWLTNPSTVLIAIAVVGIWASLGTNIVIFLAGLQGVPAELHEAAELDGAGPIRRFISITVPLISPSAFFVSVMTLIGALQTFDLVFVMIGEGNPALPHATTIVYLFYERGFLANDEGFAAAIAMVLLVIILFITVIQFALQKKWVHYE